MLNLRKRGLVFQVRGKVAGITIERSTGCTDRRAAEAFARTLERDLADPAGAARRLGDATTFSQVVNLAAEQYAVRARAKRCSPATADFYRRKLAQLLRVIGPNASVGSIRLPVVASYVATRRREGMTDHTIVKEVTALRVALRIARDHGLWAGNPAELVPSDLRSDYEPETRVVPIEHVRAVIGEMLPDRAAVVAFMAGTGAEISAALATQREDFNRDEDLVLVRGTKPTGRYRWVPVVLPRCREFVDFAFAHGGGKDDRLFRPWSKNWRDIDEACKRAKVPHFSPHDLRRTWAHWHLEAGISYDDAARAMGHVNTVMLHKVYGKLPPTSLRDRMRTVVRTIVYENPPTDQLVPSARRRKG